MTSLESKLEAILFAVAQPLALRRLSELTGANADMVKEALERLTERLKQEESGLQIILHGQEAELVTRPEVSEVVRLTLKQETQGELTRPSLETLAVLAYRGPLTRPELEQIRGVQSALILRNLMMRGLVEMKEDVRLGQPVYAVTMEFLKYLGADCVESLPNYDQLRSNTSVEQVLDELNVPKNPPTASTVAI